MVVANISLSHFPNMLNRYWKYTKVYINKNSQQNRLKYDFLELCLLFVDVKGSETSVISSLSARCNQSGKVKPEKNFHDSRGGGRGDHSMSLLTNVLLTKQRKFLIGSTNWSWEHFLQCKKPWQSKQMGTQFRLAPIMIFLGKWH